ncbi:unnamed protein product, partial [marine sediment metagenome]
MYLQSRAEPIYEKRPFDVDEQRGGMDGFLTLRREGIDMTKRIRARGPDEYLSRESVITIGVEYESTADSTYEYPYVRAVIEKVRVRHWHHARTIILAPSTSVWM